NAALVRAHLLQGPAAQARFLALFTGAASPEAALAEIEHAARALPLPFAAVVLGMGDDGHTASFFPGAANLGDLMDPDTPHLLGPVSAPSAGEPRLTFTLPPLLAADELFLHIEGDHKSEVLAAARGRGPEEAFPIRAVLRRARQPLDVLWCP
ncbi:MAG: 6-phosphogluconolactonase, partial [Rhizobiales bacterium 32-66-8]